MTHAAPPPDPASRLLQKEAMLRKEYAYEKELFREQTKTAGIARRVQQGACWHPVALGGPAYNALNQPVAEVERLENRDVDHAFESGSPVCFFAQDPAGSLRYFPFTATVSYVDGDRMVVVLPSADVLKAVRGSAEPVGVQLYFDETTYRLMFEALSQVIHAKGNRLAALRDTFHGPRRAETFTLPPVRFPWLNASQERAVNEVLRAKDVAVVHGPPGTGKTTTLVEAVCEVLRRESQVLVCAQSNMAVDWISEQLAGRGVPVLRIGNPTKVTDKMLSFTYERRFESHPDYPLLWSIRQAIRQLRGQREKGSSREKLRTKLHSLKDRATELEIRIHDALFAEARVIASTLAGSAGRLLYRQRFGTLFIDEAAQALEPACWIAIRKADRVILAGDHCQLPPTVKCVEAARNGLGRTLMQEIVENRPETVSLLRVQYRMNEAIMRFPSEWFYRGQLAAAPEVRHRGILDYDTPMEWIDTAEMAFAEEFVSETAGRLNKAEAEFSVATLSAYIEKIGKQRFLDERISVGLISPYKSQVQYLRRLIKGSARLKPFRPLLTVNTVDGFQGQERDVILISLVRANAQGEIGFLGDLRRMNVAMTRARMKLLIIGDASTLARHPFYKKLHAYVSSLRHAPA